MSTPELIFSLLAFLMVLVGLFLHGRRSFRAVRDGEPDLAWLGVVNVDQRLRPEPVLIIVGMVIFTDVLQNLGKWPDRFWQSFLLFIAVYVVLLLATHQIGAIIGGGRR
jgi:nicotinamide riboside transporter PnuC